MIRVAQNICIMKKTLLLFALVFISNCAYSQKLNIDTAESDGSRTLSTDVEYVASINDTDNINVSYGVVFMKFYGIERYYINMPISSPYNFKINKGSLLLIRIGNDEVIESKSTLDSEDSIGSIVSKKHTITGFYPIPYKDLKKIATYGIKKVRIEKVAIEVEDNAAKIDKEYNEYGIESIKEVISSRLKLIDENKNKTFKSDF